MSTGASIERQQRRIVEKYVAGLRDESLWLCRVYNDPIINAEIERRPHLHRRRQAELAKDPAPIKD